MTHLVLARKYRPKKFEDVVGQDGIVKTLKSALEQDRMAHALLFTGSRGVGKTTIANCCKSTCLSVTARSGALWNLRSLCRDR